MTRASPLLAIIAAGAGVAGAAAVHGHAAQLHRPVFAMVAVGLVLLTGVGGLTSFGQAAFVGLGAYTTAC
jgi:ABC-type branched-subunit amino acid transport system permease subunit